MFRRLRGRYYDAPGSFWGGPQVGGASMAEVQTRNGLDESQSEVKKAGGEVKEKAGEIVEEVRGSLRGAIAGQVQVRSGEAASHLGDFASAFRSSSESLLGQDKQAPAKLLHELSTRTDRLAGYLETSDAQTLLRDVEEFGRRQPWMVVAGGISLGLMTSRVLKASSGRRFEQMRREGYRGHITPPSRQQLSEETEPERVDRYRSWQPEAPPLPQGASPVS